MAWNFFMRQKSCVLIGTIVFGISACTVVAPGEGNTTSQDVNLSELHLPLEDFVPSGADDELVGRAHTMVFQGCMRRFGLSPAMPATPTADTPATARGNANRYGVVRLSEATAHGYHPAVETSESRAQDEQGLGPVEQAVALGERRRYRDREVPHLGCLGVANRRLTQGAPRADPHLAGKTSFETLEQSQQDERVAALFAAWSACMGRFGHEYDTPWQANDDPTFRTERPTEREISTARADVRCKKRVDLIDTWVPVEIEYQESAITQLRTQLIRSRELNRTMVANARHLVATVGRGDPHEPAG